MYSSLVFNCSCSRLKPGFVSMVKNSPPRAGCTTRSTESTFSMRVTRLPAVLNNRSAEKPTRGVGCSPAYMATATSCSSVAAGPTGRRLSSTPERSAHQRGWRHTPARSRSERSFQAWSIKHSAPSHNGSELRSTSAANSQPLPFPALMAMISMLPSATAFSSVVKRARCCTGTAIPASFMPCSFLLAAGGVNLDWLRAGGF